MWGYFENEVLVLRAAFGRDLGHVKEFMIGINDAGQRLDRFVSKAVPLLPGSLAQKYIRIKRIKVGGKGVRRDYMLCAGDLVQMYVNDEFFTTALDVGAVLAPLRPAEPGRENLPHAPRIVYEDENILLVNKEAGVLCHSAGGYDYGSVISVVQSYLYHNGEWRPKDENAFAPALCNRIDRNTSGIVIAAKNAESLRIINDKISLREIDKFYLAAVHGSPMPPSGRLEGYLLKDTARNLSYVTAEPRPGAKLSATEYNTLDSKGRLSLLECRLITGRAHQIRAQLYDIGHPLLGDIKYGGKQINKPYGESHQALCAYKLVFSFRSDAGMLSYLNGKTFELTNTPFAEKYFNRQKTH